MRRVAVFVAFAVAFALAGGVAAYWTAPVSYQCTNCAVADAGSLGAPTVAATATGSSRIDVTWTMPATTPTGVTYRVTRLGGGATTVTTVTDRALADTTVVAATQYTYTVVALLGAAWSSSPGSASATTEAAADPATKLALSGTQTVAAGATVTLTATVQDVNGNTVTDSTATVTFTKSSGTGTLGGLTSVTAVHGIASITLTGNLAGPLVVQAAATGLTAATRTVTVTGYSTASKLALSGTQTVAAGAEVTWTVTVQDAYGNTVANTSTSATFSKSSGTGTVGNLGTV